MLGLKLNHVSKRGHRKLLSGLSKLSSLPPSTQSTTSNGPYCIGLAWYMYMCYPTLYCRMKKIHMMTNYFTYRQSQCTSTQPTTSNGPYCMGLVWYMYMCYHTFYCRMKKIHMLTNYFTYRQSQCTFICYENIKVGICVCMHLDIHIVCTLQSKLYYVVYDVVETHNLLDVDFKICIMCTFGSLISF